MKRILLTTVLATAIAGFAGSAFAGQMLLWGTDENDHKTVQVIDRPDVAAAKPNHVVGAKSSYAYHDGRSVGGGRTMLLWGTDENDHKTVEVIRRPDIAPGN